MGYGELALLVLCGLAGPLLAGTRLGIPVVVGELAAGLVIGASGLDLIDTADPTLDFLSQIGFALLMFGVGTSLPLQDARLRTSLKRGSGAALLTFAVALPIAFAVGWASGLSRPGLVMVLIANASAALAVPALTERGLQEHRIGILVTAWVTVANVVAVLLLPAVVVKNPGWDAAAGSVAVTLATVLVWLFWRDARTTQWFKRYRKLSKQRGWGLDLRIALLALFGLAWFATALGTPVLVPAFAAGVVVAVIGQPKRLVWEVLGLAQGFFVPLFFVVLGARIDVRTLGSEPRDLLLAALILAGAAATRIAVGRIYRLPVAGALVATAMMGVPAAAVSLGLSEGLLRPGQGAAILVAAVGSVAVMTVGTRMLVAARRGSGDAASGGAPAGGNGAEEGEDGVRPAAG